MLGSSQYNLCKELSVRRNCKENQTHGLRELERITNECSNASVLSTLQKGLSSLEVCVGGMVEYPHFFHMNHNYSHRMVSIHVSVICDTLHPTVQKRASSASIVKQLFKGAFRKKPS